MKSRSLNFITSVSPGPASINGRAKIMMTVLFLMYQWIALVGSSSVLQNIICSSNYLFPFHLVALHPWGKGWYSHFAPHFLLLILIMCREHRTKKQTDSSINNCKFTNSLLPFDWKFSDLDLHLCYNHHCFLLKQMLNDNSVLIHSSNYCRIPNLYRWHLVPLLMTKYP